MFFFILFYVSEALIYTQAMLSSFYIKALRPYLKALTDCLHESAKYTSRTAAKQHETDQALQEMIDKDGAGSWPPKASHKDSWPTALRPYHDIFLELAPLLPVYKVSVDDAINQSRRIEFRTRLQELLRERVDLPAVESVLSTVENEDPSLLQGHAYNGLFACMGYLRHAFRWGTVPVVKCAQEEKIIDFPSELEIPWAFVCRRYGIKSQGGSIMSNFCCNIDEEGRLVYQVNGSMPKKVSSAEHNFVFSFTETEKRALPIYQHIVQSIISFEQGQNQECAEHLKSVNVHLRKAMRVYYEQVIESKIPRSIFVGYMQGFHGWAAGKVVDGEYTEYDGLSGGHLVLFNLLDCFLGLNTFIDEEKFANYIPASQRRFIASVKKHSFRGQVERAGLSELEAQLDGIVKQLRTFRSAHSKRTSRYLSVESPERMVMTAGASTLESGSKATVNDLVSIVDAGLRKKMKETI
ncbi:hypothetical protein PHISCL_02105 [Aspergillus sclerotialis]|uniref:Indoleamine 2,3-dioxygenase n=1 Tax=Aspergillus sclerotialis TaxID=2070753 RepID=A0A3A3A6E9_9EURO|nr:hypothetical protein PHISCL_02105 [Aspergillus sclerotialis]